MTVGKNNYSYPGQNGINILVGVRNSAGGYDVVSVLHRGPLTASATDHVNLPSRSTPIPPSWARTWCVIRLRFPQISNSDIGTNTSGFQSSWYQPQETVKWWYQTGVRTSTMIAGADTPLQTYDISAPNPETGLFYVSTTYIYATGQWINSPNAPPNAMETGVLGLPPRGLPAGGHTSPGSGHNTGGHSDSVINDKM